MAKARWIKLYYGIKDSAVWSDPIRLKAWVDILLSANYRDKDWFKNGQTIRIKRGQFVTSIRKLAESWKCSPNTVRRILKQFEELNMIEHNSGTGRYTMITVVKYGVFQDSKIPDGYTDEHSDGYTDEHTDGYSDGYTDGTQHKNNKNNKNNTKNKKNVPGPPSPSAGVPDGSDGYGAPPPGWDQECEEQFLKDKPYNPRQTRLEWWQFWKE